MESINLKNGTYSGLWGGYVIEINAGGKKVELTTDIGVRGFNIPVSVTLNDGVWSATQNGNRIKIKKVEIYSKDESE